MNKDVEDIIKRVKERIPEVHISQIQVKHPGADDDGLWFFKLPEFEKDIQIESSTGQCPFLIEHNGMKTTSEAWVANSVEEAVEKVISYLTAVPTGK